MAVTSSEAYIALNEVLQDFETEVIKAKATITEIKIISKERSETRSEIENLLKQKHISYGEVTRNVGSFGGTEIQTIDEKIRLIYKQKGNKGSGGGAEATRLTESAQCVYAAIAFGLKRPITSNDITPKNVKEYSTSFITDEKNDKILNDLNDEWVNSCVLGANELWNKFKNTGKKYTFNRGSKDVDRIEKEFKRVKQNEKVRMDINKWNPADIWIIADNFHWECLEKEKTLLGFNQCIQENLEHDMMMGVSLKKIGRDANMSVKNVFKDMKKCKDYTGYEYSKKSMDAYILLSGGTKIQYRSFGGSNSLTGFQGEVKGTQANQGKISLGPTNMILKNHGVATVPTNAAQRVRSEPSKVWDDIVSGLKTYGKMNDKEIVDLRLDTKTVTPSWLYSKLQATQLLNIIEGVKDSEKKDQIAEDLYLYASSQSKYSGAYYKLE